MSDKAKAWIWSFLLTVLFAGCFAALYWICYKSPAFYDALLRIFGGSGEMLPPQVAMTRLAVGMIPCMLFIRLALWVLAVVEKSGRSEVDGSD